jgi:hypothetical protein
MKPKATEGGAVPISVLDERVFNAVHSFKNDLTQVSAAVYYLEKGQTEKAVERLKAYIEVMVRKVDEIRALSMPGPGAESEKFDFGKLLGGIRVILFEDALVFKHARPELKAADGVIVRARRWNAVLAAEGMVMALVGGIAKTGRVGSVAVELEPGVLRARGDGAPLEPCRGCLLDCSGCVLPYSGQALEANGERASRVKQAFEACRAEGWKIRVESSDEETVFIAGFPRA